MKETSSGILPVIWKLVPDNIKAAYTPNSVIIIRQYTAVISVTSISSQETALLEIRQKRGRKNSYTFLLSAADSSDTAITPKKASSGSQMAILPPYILLFFCCFVLLFSLYHYLTQQQKHRSSSLQHITQEPVAETAVSETAMPTSAITAQPSTQTPEASPTPSAPPAQSSSPSGTMHILNLSHTSSHDLSAVNRTVWKDREHITIAFADSCQFKSCRPFSYFPNLEELYLHKNPIVSIRSLSRLSHLKILVLSNCNLKSISSLSRLKKLTVLDLSYNHELKGLSSITSLKNLQYLILSSTNASREEITLLQTKLPKCTVIY